MSQRPNGAARLVYITSPGHSGSTLLCMLLGARKGWFATGELQRLPWQLARRHTEGDSVEALTLCTCGRSFPQCPVWGRAVPAAAFEDAYANFNLSFLERQAWRPADERRPSPFLELVYRRLNETPLHRLTDAIRPVEAARIARRNWELIDRAAELSGASVVIDSTKPLVRYHLLNRFRPVDLIVLSRDVRGVASSAVKYGRDPVQACANWLRFYQRTIRYLEANAVRPAMVRYEDVCTDPESVIGRIARVFNLPLPDGPTEEFHIVAGNPSRYRPLDVKRDDSWKERLDPDTLSRIAEHLPACDEAEERLRALSLSM
jgi:hypothetical protein